MKYRKKPVIIEAIQFTWNNSLFEETVPKWLNDAILCGNVYFTSNGLNIKSLEGTMLANKNDYIIRGIKGELYPCKPDIFETTYEKIEE